MTFNTKDGTINGQSTQVYESNSPHGPGSYTGGTFNGTPWYSYFDSSHTNYEFFVFQGDLYIPSGTTVKVTGGAPAEIVAANNIIIGSNVTIDASAVNVVGGLGGPGGGGAGPSYVVEDPGLYWGGVWGQGEPGGPGGPGGQVSNSDTFGQSGSTGQPGTIGAPGNTGVLPARSGSDPSGTPLNNPNYAFPAVGQGGVNEPGGQNTGTYTKDGNTITYGSGGKGGAGGGGGGFLGGADGGTGHQGGQGGDGEPGSTGGTGDFGGGGTNTGTGAFLSPGGGGAGGGAGGGGGGGGGTIWLGASDLEAQNASIDVAGGAGGTDASGTGTAPSGAGGRVILGSNTNPTVTVLQGQSYGTNLSMSGPNAYYVSVNWGDNSSTPPTLFFGGTKLPHTYSATGTYQVQLTISAYTDNNEATYTANETVNLVAATSPAASQAISASNLEVTSTAPFWGLLTGFESSPLALAGPAGVNPYISGGTTQTPEIPGADANLSNVGLEEGSDLFGLLNTTSSKLGANTNKSDSVVWNAINNAPADALAAVIREHAPTGMPSYANDDVVLFVNLTSVVLQNPELGLSLGNPSTLEQALMNGGIATNGLTGGTLSDLTITGLPAGSVWATLVPASSGTVYVNATLGNWGVNGQSDQVLSSGSAIYITTQTPTTTVGASIPGFQAVAASPDGQTLYGVNTQENLLVVASAGNLMQQQTFQDAVAQAPYGNQTVGTTVSMPDPVAVAVSPDGNNVYVASGSGDMISIFSRIPNGNLVYQGAQSVSGIGSLTSLAVYGSSAGSDLVFVGGTGGVAEFQGDTIHNTLTSKTSNTGIGSVSSLSVSSDGNLIYATSPSSNALDVLMTSNLHPVAPSSTVLGASSVAVAGNPVIIGTLNGSTSVTGLASTTGLFVGEPVSGSGIAAGTTIALINSSSSLTLSQAATASGSASLTFFGDGPALMGTLNKTTTVTGLASTASLYVGEPVSGADIPLGTTITQVDSSSSITLSQAATASKVESLTLFDNYTALEGTLNGTTAVTGLASTANLYMGEPVSGTGIPAGTTIAQVDSSSSITLSQAATASASALLTFLSDFRPLTGTLDATTEVTGLASTLGLVEGAAVVGAGIPAGTTIAAIDSPTSIVLSQAATISGSSSLSFVTNDTTQAATLDASTKVTGLARTAGLYAGELVTGAGIPAGTTIAQINSSSSLTLSQAATASGSTLLIFPQPYDLRNYVYVTGQNQTTGTLTVFARNPGTNTLTFLQTLQDGVEGARGLSNATGLAVTPDGQYLYVTSSSENSLVIYGIQADGSLQLDQVLVGASGLNDPSGLAVNGTGDNAYVVSLQGLGSASGGLASFIAASGSNAAPSSLSLSYSNMAELDLMLGNAANTITETNHATTGPASQPAKLNINPGTGSNTINLLDPAGITRLTATGNGANRVTANVTAAGASLTLSPGDGNNFVELDTTGPSDTITINLGNGNSTALVEGPALDLTSSVTVNGGMGADTLLFDRGNDPVYYYNYGNYSTPISTPALPSGGIQAYTSQHKFGLVTYTNITNLPTDYTTPTVNTNGPYVIQEGQDLVLQGSTSASNYIQAGWDFNGDNNFSDFAINGKVDWTTLNQYLDGPNTYKLGLRVETATSTVTAYTTLTVLAARPTIQLTLPPGTATTNVPYTINFAASEVNGVNYGITGWTVNWGDGTPSITLPSTDTSATHIYETASARNTPDTITVTASDPYYFDGQTVLAGTLNGTSTVAGMQRTVTGLANTFNLYKGEAVSGTGIPAGTTIATIDSGSQITLSQTPSITGPSTLTFTSTATTATGSVNVVNGTQSVSAGGPYTISAGDSLTLKATAAGNVAASNFYWNLPGQSMLTIPGGTVSYSDGITTYQVTVPWMQLSQQWGIDEAQNPSADVPTYPNGVSVTVKYPDGAVTSDSTSLDVKPTPPTAAFTSSSNPDGSITVEFMNPKDPSKSQTTDGFTYSYDFDNNGTFIHGGQNYDNEPSSLLVPADMLYQPRTFTVHGRITAQDGTYTDYDTQVTVANANPKVTIGQQQTVGAGNLLNLNDVTFSDPFYATST